MAISTIGQNGLAVPLITSADASISGLTVGQGLTSGQNNTAFGNGVLAANTGSNNTAVGYQAGNKNTSGTVTAFGQTALSANTTGVSNSAFGQNCMPNNTTGGYNTAVGFSSLASNTTASNNTAVGYQAGYSQSTQAYNTYIGGQAGYSSTSYHNTLVGFYTGQGLTTGNGNTFIGNYTGSGCGALVTTGSKNSIIGGYSGNQGGLDIRTASNYIVLSDGDGNPYIYWDSSGNGVAYALGQGVGSRILTLQGNNSGRYSSVGFNTADNQAWNSGTTVQVIGKNTGTGRSINAAGTVNASGADYAEYMVKAGNFKIAKGDICGIDTNGKLTNVFADAISFVVKSTDPSYVGGDSWGAGFDEDPEGLEVARQTVDRIAFAGQVPVNVTGASAGQYIVPINNNGAISGQAISNPTFEQYQIAVGKVIAVKDGKPTIIVKVA